MDKKISKEKVAEYAAFRKKTKDEIIDSAKSAYTRSWYLPLLTWLIFSLSYYLLEELLLHKHYDVYFGAVVGLVSTVVCYFLFSLARLFRVLRLRAVQLIIIISSYLMWLYYGYRLLGVKEVDIAMYNWPIMPVGQPLFFASLLICLSALIWLILSLATTAKNK